ncbi:MAG: hypothetical protein U0T81_10415 [Saprospiraceae bacterium]
MTGVNGGGQSGVGVTELQLPLTTAVATAGATSCKRSTKAVNQQIAILVYG